MKQTNFQFILEYAEDFLLASGILLLMWVEIWLINRAAKFLQNKIQNLQFLNRQSQTSRILDINTLKLAFQGIISILRITSIFLVIYFSLVTFLTMIPATKVIAKKLSDFIFIPLKDSFFSILEYLPKLFTVIIIVLLFRYLSKIVKSLVVEIENKRISISGFEPHWARTTGGIAIFFINALMLILIFPSLPGYESLAFKGVAAFLGALVTIGGSSVIANYMAGIVITYMNSCRKGEWVKIDGVFGEVIERSAFAVKLYTPKKLEVSIPNAKIISTQIHNYSKAFEGKRTHIHTSISIGYDVEWTTVHDLLIYAARKTELLDNSIEPYVHQIKLDDFYIIYELNATALDVAQMATVYSELHGNILTAFDKAGVEILSPHYRYYREGSDSTIHSEERS